MFCGLIVSICVNLLLLALVLLLCNKFKQTNRNLKELIKENDTQQSTPQATNGDIYFKINKDFNITFINESGADSLGYMSQELIGKSVFGSLFEEKQANRDSLNATLNKMYRHQATLNSQGILVRKNGQKQLMMCRQRPLLNEVLECEGISFLCKDISEAKAWKENLLRFENRDLLTNTLNEKAILDRFEHDFQLAKRYNKEFSCIVIELRDLYDFISKGIDFETADKMLKVVSDVCFANLTPNANIGRVEKTKIMLILNGTSRDKASSISFKILQESINAIKKLRVDEYNAQMIVVTYTNRKNFNDTFDGMLARVKRHIGMSLKHREYGVVSSDNRGSIINKE
ncbi:MAG: PAS domain-containing protein [Alphaproteobacteria bacterium]|nr:PAS domain-containing protein [Alphaproteobacteria bacterium]